MGATAGDRLAYLVRTAGLESLPYLLGGIRHAQRHEVLERATPPWRRRHAAVAVRGWVRPPWERPPEHVAEDVVEGYVTRERASASYGVVVRADGTIDQAGPFSANS